MVVQGVLSADRGTGAACDFCGRQQPLADSSNGAAAHLALRLVQYLRMESAFRLRGLHHAGRASIIAFTMPLWATIFACLLLNEKISSSKSLGLVLGLTGLAVLIGPDLVVFNQAPLGAIFMLAAAVTWGLGTVLLKKGDWDIPIASHVAWQLLLSAIPVGIGAVLLEPVPDVTSFSPPAIIALLYIYAFPITFSQWAYMKVVNMLPASIAAIGTLLVPVIGVYSSHFILSEPVGLRALTALALVCTGLLCVLVLPGLSSLHKDR